MVRRKTAHLWIRECKIKECDNDGSRWHYHKLNPRGQAMKGVEMTVVRAIRAITVFDALDKDQDWTDVPNNQWPDVLGDKRYVTGRLVEELWVRYKSWSLHQQVLDLAANLIIEDLPKNNRKEIEDGLVRINKSLNSRRKR